jgi:hypothetical protein
MLVGQIVFDQKSWKCFCQPNVSQPKFFLIKRPKCFHHPNVSRPVGFRPKEVGQFCQLNVSRPNPFQPREVEVFFVIQMSVGQIVFDQKTWKCFHHPNVSRPNCFWPKDMEVFLSSKCQSASWLLTKRSGTILSTKCQSASWFLTKQCAGGCFRQIRQKHLTLGSHPCTSSTFTFLANTIELGGLDICTRNWPSEAATDV